MEHPSDNFTLTDDQQEALDSITKWYEESDETYKSLNGYAGTGKTTLLRRIVKSFLGEREEKGSKIKIAVTAPTNKAVKVLNNYLAGIEVTTMTIHSLLNIKPKRRGTIEIFEPIDWRESGLQKFDLVIIDECSMVSSEDKGGERSLLSIIKEQASSSGVKILFCGDQAQLQPIGETVSRCFNFSPIALTEIVRHDNEIAKSAAVVRERKTATTVSELLSKKVEHVTTLGNVSHLFKNFKKHPDKARFLSWRNKRVEYVNKKLREYDMGETDLPLWLPGDRIIAQEPCSYKKGDLEITLLMNSEEAEVLEVKESEKDFKLKCKTDAGRSITLRTIQPSYEKKLNRYLNDLASKKKWKQFWAVKKSFHNIRHCYALTVHKSQGSTFENVVLDFKDISLNRDVEERNQLLYVAITRASKKVFII